MNDRIPALLLNAPVLTADGIYSMRTISLEQARRLAAQHGIDSAIGHDATAAILSTLLGLSVPVMRKRVVQVTSQTAIVFRLLERLPEGVVLARVEEIEALGYEFAQLDRLS